MGKRMKILAIDSSALAGSVAVLDGDRLLAETFVNTSNTHSETLLPMAAEVLDRAELTADDIDLFAVTTGPGSFTGVRIGVSMVKGLAFGKNKPCVGVSTLDALAAGLKELKGIIVSVVDARRCGLYNAVFISDGARVERLTPDKLDMPEDLASEVTALAKEKRMNIYFAGDGYDKAMSAAEGARVKPTPVPLRLTSAYCVAMAAIDRYESAADTSAFTDTALAAVYIRPTEAERERLAKLENNK